MLSEALRVQQKHLKLKALKLEVPPHQCIYSSPLPCSPPTAHHSDAMFLKLCETMPSLLLRFLNQMGMMMTLSSFTACSWDIADLCVQGVQPAPPAKVVKEVVVAGPEGLKRSSWVRRGPHTGRESIPESLRTGENKNLRDLVNPGVAVRCDRRRARKAKTEKWKGKGKHMETQTLKGKHNENAILLF